MGLRQGPSSTSFASFAIIGVCGCGLGWGFWGNRQGLELCTGCFQLRARVDSLENLVARLVLRVGVFEQEGFEVVAPEPPTASVSLAPGTGLEESFRREMAEQVGAFFRRCLRGEPRANSGRHQVKLVNVVCRDYSLKEYNSPLIVRAFAQVKDLCLETSWGIASLWKFPRFERPRCLTWSAPSTACG